MPFWDLLLDLKKEEKYKQIKPKIVNYTLQLNTSMASIVDVNLGTPNSSFLWLHFCSWMIGAPGPRGQAGQPCALCYHYNILYFLLNLFYHSKLKFILPKFGKQKHLNFASEMRNEEEGARTNRRSVVCQVTWKCPFSRFCPRCPGLLPAPLAGWAIQLYIDQWKDSNVSSDIVNN